MPLETDGVLDPHLPRSYRRCTKRDRTSSKVIEEDAGIGVYPRGHANPHAPIMDGGPDKGKSLQVLFLIFAFQKMKDKGCREMGKERVKLTALVYD